MAANDPFLDELEDPAPDDVGAPDDRKLKNVLPLRSHLVVDGKKYEGERVSRGNAEVPTFEFEEDPEHDGLDEPAVHEDVAMDGSDEAKDDSPSESDDDQIMIEKEAEIRKGEEAISARLAEEKARETKRAEAVKNQTVCTHFFSFSLTSPLVTKLYRARLLTPFCRCMKPRFIHSLKILSRSAEVLFSITNIVYVFLMIVLIAGYSRLNC